MSLTMYLTHVQLVVLDWCLYCECVCPSVRQQVLLFIVCVSVFRNNVIWRKHTLRLLLTFVNTRSVHCAKTKPHNTAAKTYAVTKKHQL